MTPHIVVEGPTDEGMLRDILKAGDGEPVKVVSAGGRSSAVSMARTLAVRRGAPVALALDADTSNPSSVQQAVSILRGSLHAASHAVFSDVFLFVPEIEILFFEDIPGLERSLGITLGEKHLAQFPFAPRTVLRELISHSALPDRPASTVFSLLDMSRIKRQATVKAMLSFIQLAHARHK